MDNPCGGYGIRGGGTAHVKPGFGVLGNGWGIRPKQETGDYDVRQLTCRQGYQQL